MSWLKKLFSKDGGQTVLKAAEAGLESMPTMSCAAVSQTALSLTSSQSDGEACDEPASKQRRYFVKKGLYVDNEEEQEKANQPSEEIPDQRPVDLKTLFPKLSLR